MGSGLTRASSSVDAGRSLHWTSYQREIDVNVNYGSYLVDYLSRQWRSLAPLGTKRLRAIETFETFGFEI